MSNATSVMNGAQFDGAVTVKDAGLKGMITLRGDLADDQVAQAVQAALGVSLPAQRGIERNTVAWMSPDELLLFCDYTQADDVVAQLEQSLKGRHFLALNVSDARAQFTLQGTGVREVIAKGSPANLGVTALQPGEIRRSRLGQVAVAFWLTDETTLHLVCFRSVGAFVYKWLTVAAAKDSLPEVL